MLTSLPTDVMVELFYHIPSEITTTCRSVCKQWYSLTFELRLWQKVAAHCLIDIKPDASAHEVEVKLKRYMVISSDEKLKQLFQKFFFNIPEGETRAVHYLSASVPNAFGFYIRTKNSNLLNQITGPECASINGLKDFIEKTRGLTIIGKDGADHGTTWICKRSFANSGERIEEREVGHKIHSYFIGTGNVKDHSLSLNDDAIYR
jgi:hypothetical protein